MLFVSFKLWFVGMFHRWSIQYTGSTVQQIDIINNTARWEKGGGRHFFHQVEPNWPLPHSTVQVPQLRDARQAGWVTFCSICASTMPRVQNRTAKGSTLMEDETLYPSGYIIYLWFSMMGKMCASISIQYLRRRRERVQGIFLKDYCSLSDQRLLFLSPSLSCSFKCCPRAEGTG